MRGDLRLPILEGHTVMANPEHLAVLKQGADAWNTWLKTMPSSFVADLEGADLQGASLSGVNLIGAQLRGAKLGNANLDDAMLVGADLEEADVDGASLDRAVLTRANLRRCKLKKSFLIRATLRLADLTGADLEHASLNYAQLRGATMVGATLTSADLAATDMRDVDLSKANLALARLRGADLAGANLSGADLAGARLTGANLARTTLSAANLSGADLTQVAIVEANLSGATLDGARVYGASAWSVVLTGTRQSGLVITPEDEPEVVVDNLEVAQFIYLLLNNKNIRDVIDTITSKVVLILGRFTDERKAVLDALRDTLRTHGLTPVLFDFTKPTSKDVTGTVETLARMARFIVADLTDPSSVPHELAMIVPFLRTTPVVLLRQAGTTGYSMASDFEAYGWVVPMREYPDQATLVSDIDDYVISPAEARLRIVRPEVQDQ
jgi:uncharacterized protein YjbI with pentapeptide repeats